MDCFHDFCLGCDRESMSGPYCSQACRLADLEKASTASSSMSSTPTPSPHHQQHLSWSSVESSTDAGAQSTSDRYSSYSPRTLDGESRQPQSFFMATPTTTTTTMTATGPADSSLLRCLSPSSSRSSLSSAPTPSSTEASGVCRGGLSEQALAQLKLYFDSFDTTRTAKRRQSWW